MRTTVVATLLTLLVTPALSQNKPALDGFYGTWSLDGSRSHYGQGTPPEQMTVLIEPAPNGLAYRSDANFNGGRVASSQFVARLDATPALVVGTSGFWAPVSLTVADDGGIDAVYTSGFKKVAWSHWAVTADGSELTMTTTYLDPQGEKIQNVTAFHRPASG